MNTRLPIVEHQRCKLEDWEIEFAEQVASRLREQHPELIPESLFQDLVPKKIVDAATLHVDDLTGIRKVTASTDHASLQERARVRAVEGDVLATALPEVDGYESYCRNALELGDVQWIHPQCQDNPLLLAQACWEDRDARRELIRAIRSKGLRYIHPHMGTRAIWELALLLNQASHRPVEVIGPTPALTAFVNDKGSFNMLVRELFGVNATPDNAVAWNIASVAKRLQEMDHSSRFVAVKLPNAANGAGNLLIPISEVIGRDLHQIDAMLRENLPQIHYDSGDELLVTVWVDDIIQSPSAQLWLPPPSQGLPILEGLFFQLLEGSVGRFQGFVPAELPTGLETQITRQCLLLARVFQLLGYVGRCSFDMLLIGKRIEESQMKFIECNGRWGGTSLPMTLMNRVFSDWSLQPFESHTISVQGICNVSFSDLLSNLGEQMYCRKSRSGKIVILNPQRAVAQSKLSFIALKDSWTSSDTTVDFLARHLQVLVGGVASKN